MPGIKIEIVKNDYGYAYIFTLKDPDGNVVDISGLTVTLRATHSDFPDVTLEKEIDIQSAENGQCSYTLAAGDFTKEGLYYAEIQTTEDESGSEQQITYQGFSIVVIPKV